MATCPLCLYSSPADAPVCTRCGKFRFPQAELAATARSDAPTFSGGEDAPSQLTRTVRGPVVAMKTTITSNSGTALAVNSPPSVSDDTGINTLLANPTPAAVPIRSPKLSVIRGERMDGQPFPIYEGKNFIGRSSDKPVDIDLTGLEAKDQIWSSRQHAVITFEVGALAIEDLNSLNGTFVNRSRLHPGQLRQLNPGDVVQIGTVQFRVEG